MAHLPFCVDPTLLIFGLFSLLFLPVGRAHVLLLSYALFGLDGYGLLTFGLFFYPIYVIHLCLPPPASPLLANAMTTIPPPALGTSRLSDCVPRPCAPISAYITCAYGDIPLDVIFGAPRGSLARAPYMDTSSLAVNAYLHARPTRARK